MENRGGILIFPIKVIQRILIEAARHSTREATKPHAMLDQEWHLLSWPCQYTFGAKHYVPNPLSQELFLKNRLGRPAWTQGTGQKRRDLIRCTQSQMTLHIGLLGMQFGPLVPEIQLSPYFSPAMVCFM